MRVLIVDDEKLTREGIRQHVNWKRFAIEEILTAKDGQDALEVAGKYPIDIAICDVRMPRMDGIRFAQHLYESQPDCRVIFLSGYVDKQYLFSAIRLHAVAYVEKPFSTDELEAAIEEAIRQISTEKSLESGGMVTKDFLDLRIKLALDLIGEDLFDPEELHRLLSLTKLDSLGASVTTVLMAFRIAEEAPTLAVLQRDQNLFTLVSRFNAPTHNYLLCARQGEGLVLHLLTRSQEVMAVVALLLESAEQLAGTSCRVLVGVGDTHESIVDARLSYAQAQKALERTFFSSDKILRYAHIANLVPYQADEKHEQGILNALQLGDEERALKDAAALMQTLAVSELSSRAACVAVLSLLARFADADSARDAELVRACQNIGELGECLANRIRGALSRNSVYSGDNRTVYEVLAIIRNEYHNPRLSIASIAHKVYLTPNYLSAVFKKETGKTINACLAQYRIVVAEQLLSDPSLHLYEIAMRCGFGSVENFSRSFKKIKGSLPSVLRRTI